MDDLIAKLEAATEGSRELDRAVAKAAGFDLETFVVPDDHPMLKGGFEFAVSKDGKRSGLPPYTSSLDARLPWENIIMTHRLSDGYLATQAEGTWACAKTEPLARRIAALKARQSDG